MTANSIRLYRFLSASAFKKSISSWSLRVGRIHELNDPFEWRFGLENVRPDAEQMAQDYLAHVVGKLSAQFGVFCFSASAEDPVLWSHYADKHTGVAIEVDYLLSTIHKVEYTDSRPTIDANRVNDPVYISNTAGVSVQKLVTTKSLGWSYEKEWRGYVNISECELRDGHYFKAIPSDFVTRVILGARCTLDSAEISSEISKHTTESIPVSKARYSIKKYTVEW